MEIAHSHAQPVAELGVVSVSPESWSNILLNWLYFLSLLVICIC